jgi:hypothetical protein
MYQLRKMIIKKLPLLQLIVGVPIIIGSLIIFITQASFGQSNSSINNTYYCGTYQNKPATFVRDSITFPIIIWISNDLFQHQNPKQRCESASYKFEEAYQKGFLNYMTYDKFDRKNAICVAGYKNGKCLQDGVLFYLNPDTNPEVALSHLTEFHKQITDGPLKQGSELIFYENGKAYINVHRLIREIQEKITVNKKSKNHINLNIENAF